MLYVLKIPQISSAKEELSFQQAKLTVTQHNLWPEHIGLIA